MQYQEDIHTDRLSGLPDQPLPGRNPTRCIQIRIYRIHRIYLPHLRRKPIRCRNSTHRLLDPRQDCSVTRSSLRGGEGGEGGSVTRSSLRGRGGGGGYTAVS